MTRVAKAVWLGSKYALDRPDVERAVATLREGGLVVYPTDTLYGLGADASSPAAVAKVAAAKGRPGSQPVSVAVSGLSQIEPWGDVGTAARNFIHANLPGPYTVILRPTPAAPKHLVSAVGVAFRIPRHPVPALLTRVFGPITATSANRHDGPAPAEAGTALEQLGDAVALYIDAGACELGAASTVVDFTGDRPKILRQGAVPGRG
jgi:L-threonylcarbamoyladenylate synthase